MSGLRPWLMAAIDPNELNNPKAPWYITNGAAVITMVLIRLMSRNKSTADLDWIPPMLPTDGVD